MRGTVLAAAIAAAFSTTALAAIEAPPLPVKTLDVERYSGLWHEMARYRNPTQGADCVNPTAEYGYDDSGDMAVVNSCSNMNGEITATSLGTAFRPDAEGPAAFSIDYGDGAKQDYWVIALADDYSWSIVSTPQRDRLWILTREPVTGGPTMRMLIAKADELGFDTAKLFYSQKGGIDLTSSLER